MRFMIHISAIVCGLFLAVEIIASAEPANGITTEVPRTTSQVNLANETEYVDTTLLINEYQSTNPADNDTASLDSGKSTSTTEEPNISSTSTSSSKESTSAPAENKTMTPEEIQRLLLPPAKVEASILHLNSTDETHAKNIKESDCPALDEANKLSQTQLLSRLTHGCRYDRLERPIACKFHWIIAFPVVP